MCECDRVCFRILQGKEGGERERERVKKGKERGGER